MLNAEFRASKFPCIGLHHLYAIIPRRGSNILGSLSYGISIEIYGHNISLATLCGHKCYEPRTGAHIQYAIAVPYPSPCPE